jgi:hypothetical protein
MSFGRFSAAEQVKARNTCIKYRFGLEGVRVPISELEIK